MSRIKRKNRQPGFNKHKLLELKKKIQNSKNNNNTINSTPEFIKLSSLFSFKKKETIWCLHEDCLEIVETFESYSDLQKHIETYHT